MNRFDWNKLSPDEFQRLQDYISCKYIRINHLLNCKSRSLDAPKKVKDVVAILEKDPTWLAHKYDEVNFCQSNLHSRKFRFFSNWITKVFDNFLISYLIIPISRKNYVDIYFYHLLKNPR